MTTTVPRHAFRTDDAAMTTAPVAASAREAVEGIEASERTTTTHRH
ncbi:hypothetical protein [Streptomyces sp. NPDC058622]